MLIRKFLYRAMSFKPVLRHVWRTKLDRKIVVLIYHEILNDSEEITSWTVTRRSDFERQMDYLSGHFNIISLEDALAVIKGEKASSSGPGRPNLVVTFDDGSAGNYSVMLPVIKSRNIPVTVFVSTSAVLDQLPYWDTALINAFQTDTPFTLDLDCVSLGKYAIDRSGREKWEQIYRLLLDLKKISPALKQVALKSITAQLGHQKGPSAGIRPLTVEELRKLAESPLVTIGAHSHCHSLLTQLDDRELKESIETSKRLLESWTRNGVKYFAYPHGNYDGRVIKALKDAGFECALTTSPAVWDGQAPAFEIPRIGIGRFDTFECFKIKASGGLRMLVPAFMRPNG